MKSVLPEDSAAASAAEFGQPAGRGRPVTAGSAEFAAAARPHPTSSLSRAAERLPRPVGAALLAALFVGPLLAVALAVEDATPLLWTSLIADLVLLFAFAVATYRRPLLFVGVLTVWFVMQRLVLALVAPHVSADALRLLMTYKEGFYMVLLAAGFCGVLLRYRGHDRSFTPVLLADLLAVALLALLLVSFLTSSADLSPRLTYARRFAAPLLLYLGGRLLLPDRQQLLAGLRLLVLAALGVAAFGIVERFLLDASFWSDRVDALGFYGSLAESGLLPSSWIKVQQELPDGIFVAYPVGVPVRRLVSTYLEPTTLGAFLAFALLLLLFVPAVANGRSRLLWAAGCGVLALAVAATVSRGAMQIALIGGGLVLAATAARSLRPPWRLESAVIVAIAAFLAAALLVASLSFSEVPNRREQLQDLLATRLVSGLESVPPPPPATGAPLNEGAQAHVNGLRSGLEQMLDDPLGVGVGTAGAWSAAPEVGGESTVGTLAAQLGAPGLALWLAFHAAVVASLLQVALRTRRSGDGGGPALPAAGPLALAGALMGLFATAWFSESAAGLLANAFFFLFAGWAVAALAPAAQGLRFCWLPQRTKDG